MVTEIHIKVIITTIFINYCKLGHVLFCRLCRSKNFGVALFIETFVASHRHCRDSLLYTILKDIFLIEMNIHFIVLLVSPE